METFQLYRVKIEESELFVNQPPIDRSKLLREAIMEKPFWVVSRGPAWRIGNVVEWGDKEIFFALGKVTRATHGMYDESAGDFIDESLEEALHTHIAIDLDLQVCAIRKKSNVSQNVRTIANNLGRVLGASNTASSHALSISLGEISDPHDFLLLIDEAERISMFEMTLGPPNPFDANEDFQKPMEKFVSETQANLGKARVTGENLRREPLKELSQSAAATGNTAQAKIQGPGDSKPTLKRLRGNPATITVGESATDAGKSTLFGKIRSTYRRVRGID